MAEECAKSDALDGVLSGGLCGIVGASVCGSGDFALVPLAVTRSRSCVFVFTPSVRLLVDESPRGGLSNAVWGGVKRFTTAPSEGNEKEDRVDVGIPSTIPGG